MERKEGRKEGSRGSGNERGRRAGEPESWTDTERARAAPEPVRMEEVEEGGRQTGPVRASQDTWGRHRLEGRLLASDNMLFIEKVLHLNTEYFSGTPNRHISRGWGGGGGRQHAQL